MKSLLPKAFALLYKWLLENKSNVEIDRLTVQFLRKQKKLRDIKRQELNVIRKAMMEIVKQVKISRADVDIEICKRKYFDYLLKAFNSVNRKKEQRDKKEYLKNILEEGRSEKLAVLFKEEEIECGKIFYLCSKHYKSAKDHEDYQGKVYVDRAWRSYVPNKELRRKVARYIKLNNVLEYQYIIGEPVYMVTRPNCRHFFIPLAIDQVLGKTEKEILKENPKAFIKKSESKSRKQLNFEYLKLRFKTHSRMLKVNYSPFIQKLIKTEISNGLALIK